MASRSLVKNYLAQWMQMGKAIILSNDNEEVYLFKIVQGEKYSPAFNKLWSEISKTRANEAYLSGTDQTISDLLSNQWEIISCARCDLPVPCLDMGARSPISCPCDDLPSHPNLESVSPHPPVKLSTHLNNLRDRLNQKSEDHIQTSSQSRSDINCQTDEDDSQTVHNLRSSILKLVARSAHV